MAKPTHYDGLYNLLEQDRECDRYFSNLPGYVQDSVCQRADNICTKEDLYTYAENLLSGDQ